jgi:hypothetical protein
MIFILSGEGPTDIGDWGFSETGGRHFRPGPMTLFIDILAETRLGFSPLAVDNGRGDICIFIDEHDLTRRGRTDPLVLSGKKAGKGNAYHAKTAQTLGIIAKTESSHTTAPVIAVLFRDGDGTRSRDEWEAKRTSIVHGFARVDFPRGVAMVPHPKSEAWLIFALQGYRGGEALEARSGNDASPRSLKGELEELLGEPGTREIINELIQTGRIDPHKIDMPSFNIFREDLSRALV